MLSVLFFHAGFDHFSGGFVGVDVFFVISGYLITMIILREIEAARFTVAGFYERRVRRIFPALFVVVAFALIAGAAILAPIDLRELGASAAATTVFASNMYFWWRVGYFDGPAHEKPLLHTWSLAVEEQFYLLFPLILVFIARYLRGRYGVLIAACVVVSFFLSLRATATEPSAAFYWAPMRAWELMTGALLAVGAVPAIRNAAVREAAGVAGLLLVLASFVLISAETPFPGVAAVAPVLGTALLIHTGESGDCRINRLLAVRPLVFGGLISYSLYLWHWPLLVYAKFLAIRELTTAESAGVLILSFFAAVASWKFVETPFRNREFLRRRSLFAWSAAVMSVVMAAGVTLVLLQGALTPNRNAVYGARAAGDPDWYHWNQCTKRARALAKGGEPCAIGGRDGEKRFVLWGDSHAEAFATGVDEVAARQEIGGYMITKHACPPLLGISRGSSGCPRFNEMVLEFLADRPELDTVVLSARWALSATGQRYGQEEGERVRLVDLQAGDTDSGEANEVLLARGLERTVAALRKLGRRVVVVGQVPEIGINVPGAYQVARLTGRDVNDLIAPTTAEFERRRAGVQRATAGLESVSGVTVVEPSDMLCDSRICAVTVDGYALYRDNGHLSSMGAIYVAPILADALSGA